MRQLTKRRGPWPKDLLCVSYIFSETDVFVSDLDMIEKTEIPKSGVNVFKIEQERSISQVKLSNLNGTIPMNPNIALRLSQKLQRSKSLSRAEIRAKSDSSNKSEPKIQSVGNQFSKQVAKPQNTLEKTAFKIQRSKSLISETRPASSRIEKLRRDSSSGSDNNSPTGSTPSR
jgi:hypothetical protein